PTLIGDYDIVPMLRVGMQFVTLCVTNLRCTAHSGSDAERPEMRSHAEVGTIIDRGRRIPT
ncbi:hypothetical protein C6380_29280, partial [Pseudomonas syringae pv. actinidiae]